MLVGSCYAGRAAVATGAPKPRADASELTTDAEQLAAARELIDRGAAQYVLVSRGAQGPNSSPKRSWRSDRATL